MTIHGDNKVIKTCTFIYMVLFISNYEFDAEPASISLIDIIFSGGFSFYHKYKVIDLL